MIGGGSWAAEEQLEELKEGEIRRVYFTFAEDLEYEQCMEMEEAYSWGQAWYGVRVSDAYMGYGFSNHAVGPIFEDPEINKSYPGLLDTVDDGSWNDEEERRQEEARARQEHFFSMVRYLGDQSVFTRMMGEREIPVKEITEYIDQNGFRLYGCVIMADKELIQKMSEDDGFTVFILQMSKREKPGTCAAGCWKTEIIKARMAGRNGLPLWLSFSIEPWIKTLSAADAADC